ncbi:hypothetical protein CBOM_07438 [Ceraceosorus bombacis]|uniref:Uncharacterized protein n=1 Tax=Ceraceosorus bombacis TaxID=401625 RepID=A0A0P1BCG9_9BASI|nr:hypothetical protein CBOM_07438 [Ceraceosorus bombacis]
MPRRTQKSSWPCASATQTLSDGHVAMCSSEEVTLRVTCDEKHAHSDLRRGSKSTQAKGIGDCCTSLSTTAAAAIDAGKVTASCPKALQTSRRERRTSGWQQIRDSIRMTVVFRRMQYDYTRWKGQLSRMRKDVAGSAGCDMYLTLPGVLGRGKSRESSGIAASSRPSRST